MDGIIGQADKRFLNDLINYRKNLLQRNALLKMNHKKNKLDIGVLEIYNEQLVNLGNEIYKKENHS